MRTPGLVLYNSLAPGSLEKTDTYAQMAEERGFRSVLVSEAGSDSLGVHQKVGIMRLEQFPPHGNRDTSVGR
jgi:hypothetical protein